MEGTSSETEKWVGQDGRRQSSSEPAETWTEEVGSCLRDGIEWVQLSSCLPPSAHSDIINSPKLVGELQEVRLGSLLPPNQIRRLEATFLSNEVVSPAPAPGQGRGRKEAEAWGQTGRGQGA